MSASGRLLIEWLVVALLSLGVVWGLTRTTFSDRADNAIYDALMATQTHAASDAIFIVAIDEASLAELGRWPWPRSLHAQRLRHGEGVQKRGILEDVLLEFNADLVTIFREFD